VEISYDFMHETQMVVFLCCHTDDLKTGTLDCDGKPFEKLTGHAQPNFISIMVQATSDGFEGNFPIEAVYCPVLNIPTCPVEKMQTSMPESAGHTVGGGGGGGGGLTLVACFGPVGFLPNGIWIHALTTRILEAPNQGYYGPGLTEAQCLQKCLAWPTCAVASRNVLSGDCSIYAAGTYTLTIDPTRVSSIYIHCITLEEIAQLQYFLSLVG
jgi:hypothetical protein